MPKPATLDTMRKIALALPGVEESITASRLHAPPRMTNREAFVKLEVSQRKADLS